VSVLEGAQDEKLEIEKLQRLGGGGGGGTGGGLDKFWLV